MKEFYVGIDKGKAHPTVIVRREKDGSLKMVKASKLFIWRYRLSRVRIFLLQKVGLARHYRKVTF